jgi:TolB-like protein/DNA-binding winged helix-turn-helix (wHTH) protein
MSTAEPEANLAFAGYFLDARKRLLIGPDGTPVNMSSRAFETLHYLASHPHELIDKHRLMKAVWANSVVEENNLNQQISTLRKVLGEAAGNHRFIVTVSGRGYRFVEDVQRVGSLPFAAEGPRESSAPVAGNGSADDSPARNVSDAAARRGWRTLWPGAVVAAIVVLMVGAAYVVLAGREWGRAVPMEVPSIAVLPFADVSPNHDQGYFADGLSEELLNALGRLNGLRVIGRTSSFSFKGKNGDVRKVAAALGVQHVLEGSVRRDGDHLRITAQLVDATNGSQLWAGMYDRRLGDVFAIQKQIADSVADTLQLTLRPARVAAIAGGTRNIEAYEAYLSARAVTNNGGSTRASEAVGLLERAVQLDPDFALAWAALAEGYTFAVDFPPSSAVPLTPVELQRRISRAALRAFELAPEAPQTLRSAGMVSMQNRDWAEAERRLRRAGELAGPYDYDANLLYAWFLMNVGRASEAIPYEERAMRAEPLLMRPVAFLAALYEMRGELDKAEALLLASKDLKGNEAMRRQGLIMIRLARHDRSGLRRLLTEKGGTLPCASLDNPRQALEDVRRSYADAMRSGAHGQLVPVAQFASFLGDQALALDALRATGPTQNLFVIWRPALSEVRRLPGFEEFVRELGLVDYWRASGDWGEFCRETGGGGFTCR